MGKLTTATPLPIQADHVDAASRRVIHRIAFRLNETQYVSIVSAES